MASDRTQAKPVRVYLEAQSIGIASALSGGRPGQSVNPLNAE